MTSGGERLTECGRRPAESRAHCRREVTVTGEPQLERNAREVGAGILETLEGQAKPEIEAERVQR